MDKISARTSLICSVDSDRRCTSQGTFWLSLENTLADGFRTFLFNDADAPIAFVLKTRDDVDAEEDDREVVADDVDETDLEILGVEALSLNFIGTMR